MVDFALHVHSAIQFDDHSCVCEDMGHVVYVSY